MKPLFVFDGLNVVGKNEIILENGKLALEKTNDAWNLYGDNMPDDAVKAFGTSGMTHESQIVIVLIVSRRGCGFRTISNPPRRSQ